MSIAGGVHRAFARAEEVGANCMQIFLKSNVQWRFPNLSKEDIANFKSEQQRTGIETVIAHACYLANPASPDGALLRKSVDELKKEAALAAVYGIKWLVLHPGNHRGQGTPAAQRQVASVLAEVLKSTAKTGILVETTSGAGTAVGSSLSQIAAIIRMAGAGARLGVCIDTAHVFAAGYDLSTQAGYESFKAELAKLRLTRRVKAIHVNDSKGALASRADRHDHIGKGHIGREGFARIMRDADFALIPKILETPKGMCGKRSCDRVNISLLRRLAKS
jgi:deoxyribonuclease-4